MGFLGIVRGERMDKVRSLEATMMAWAVFDGLAGFSADHTDF